jgi:protein YIPF1/2
MTPTFNQSFLINKIRPNPDLYGPFWICISLIFTIAIAGNIVSFLHNFGSDYKWHTDFHKGNKYLTKHVFFY